MSSIDLLITGVTHIFEYPFIILLVVAGVFIGMVFGAIPGLSATLAVTLFLPFSYTMSSTEALSFLVAIYVGGVSGGLISACLLNIPGTPSSIVTTFDGAPMARGGKPGEALSIGVFASLVGGMVSAIILIFVAPLVAKVALIFGSWEYAAMGFMGLCLIITLTGKDPIKGIVSAAIGALFAMIGIDTISNAARFTFGFWQLSGGLALLAVLMGIFALSEILIQVQDIATDAKPLKVTKVPLFPPKETLKGTGKALAGSSIIGVIVGILPGVGASTSTLLAYSYSRSVSKNPEKFGTGCAEGIIASESANNGTCGGALVPMLTMGIPGDAVTAVLLGAFIAHGIEAGPLLFVNSRELVGVIFVMYFFANVVMYIMELGLMKAFVKVLLVPLNYLLPSILLMCIMGTFAANNRTFDIWALLIIGIIGYLLRFGGFALPPIVLGYILGPIMESNLRRAMISSQGNLSVFFTRPIAVVLVLVGIVLLLFPIIKDLKKTSSAKKQHEKVTSV